MSKIINTLNTVIKNEYADSLKFQSRNKHHFMISKLDEKSNIIDGEKQYLLYECNQDWDTIKKLILFSESDSVITTDLDTLAEIADGLSRALYYQEQRKNCILI